jgi:hypothetical protein
MAVTVVDDFTNINNADAVTNWMANGVFSSAAVDTNINTQGTGSISCRVNNTGIGNLLWDSGAATLNVSNTHVGIWIFSMHAIETLANGGFRLRISTDADGLANFGEYYIGGSNAFFGQRDNFHYFVVDVNKAFGATNGTPPALTAVRTIGSVGNMLSSNGRISWFCDQIKSGSGITITGGASAPRGSVEVAANDATNGRGVFKDVGGAYYIVGRITIGDVTAATNSTFEDSNKVWVFEDQPCSATFHKIEFVGGTGTNRATFGTSSGTGNAKEGSGGNTFLSGGAIPFRIEAIDSEITSELFGCTLTGPAALRDDTVVFLVEDNSGGPSFVDDTRDANDADANDANFFPATPAVNDAPYWGHDERFYQIKVNTGTAGAGTYTVTWEYSTASGWSSLTDVTDGTTNFKTSGLQTVTYAIPDDWVTRNVNGITKYWIRARRDGGTTTTAPIMTQAFTVMGGDVRWEHTNAEAIRCTFTNMGSIRIRNSAKLKKCVITDSVVPAKHAAVDFGATDPALDTVRDLVIQNSSKGILLKGSGNATYNFRNIKFAGNTNDVRVDYGGGDTVTINVLEGGDTPTIDNVNASTVVINNSVNVTVTVIDEAGAPIQGARVYVQDAAGPFNDVNHIVREFTDASGIATETFNFVSNLAVTVRTRLKGKIPDTQDQTITSSGLNLTVTLRDDPNQE